MNFNNKNILLVFQGGNLGGAERQGFGLARFLAQKKNCKVDLLFVYSNKQSQEFKEVLETSPINRTFFFGEPYVFFKREISIKNLKRLKWSAQYLLNLRKELIQYKYHTIIPFQNTPSKVAYYLYKLLPTVKFAFWHQLGLDILKYDIFEHIAVNNIPCIIGNAENCLEVFRSDYKIKDNRLNLLPQYLSLEKEIKDKEAIRQSLKIPQNSFVFGMVAHFTSFKYHMLLLNVFKLIQHQYPNAHLVLMGNKRHGTKAMEIYNSLSKEIKKDSLQQKVTLLSNKSVVDVLNILDVGVLLSLIEGTPNVVMEYMLYGLPVICSNHPGCVSLLKDSELLVENNEQDIFRAMKMVLTSKSLREKESRNNLENIKNYNVESYVDKLEIILNKCFS
ncbi:glycosyltransferase family 4 protein [Tamlana fucoidanivorans]|uniref:Glycosyltransferase family 4 protein n=1 Tax=Allotamlana fucoidanivorans TaxID=2583814 RepID=A0A5C4SP21_9FLAO|nr:glycosyltransferase family 4 protein [Tamlana fucoidanivorans]TNJ45767.1 glycosyltransferase family 4 protein [Tamlana fucoidanivorans]